jgi:hypothetical protein
MAMTEFAGSDIPAWPEARLVPTLPLDTEVDFGVAEDIGTTADDYAETDYAGDDPVDTSCLGIESGLGYTEEASVEELGAAWPPVVTADELAGLQGDQDEAVARAYRGIGIDPDDEKITLQEPPKGVTFVPVRLDNDTATVSYALDCNPPEPGSELAEMVDAFVVHEQALRDSVHFEHEVPLTTDEQAAFQAITERYGELVHDLGVPEAEGRITQQAHVHMFETEDDFMDAVVNEIGIDPDEAEDAAGACFPLRGVLLTRSEEPITRASDIAHEVAHDIGVVNMVPTGEIDDNGRETVMITHGHNIPRRGLNELTADMLADRVVRPMLGDSQLTYKGLDAIGDAVIRQVAGPSSPQFVEDELERGYLNGDGTARFWLEGTLGEDNMDTLLGMTGDESLSESLDIARQMGLPAAVQMIQDMIDKKPVRLFGWR